MLEIGVVGINHNLTPIEIREKFNFSESKRIEISSVLQNKIDEIVILSTCNRSEIYYANNKASSCKDIIIDFYKSCFSYQQIDEYIFSETGREMVEHLFMVSGGLDSKVIGEDQILNQVKSAMEFSMELKFSKKILNRLFQMAISVGKKIRNKVGISTIPISASYIGVKMIQEKIPNLSGKKALLIGAGEMSELSLTYLYNIGLSQIYITNRRDSRLDELFKRFPKTKKIEYGDRYEIIREVDILISATAAVHTIIKYEEFPELDKDIYILDLGLPRDIDERIGNLKRVSLYTLDDLENKSVQNLEKRRELVSRAEKLINEDVDDYMDWLRTSKVAPILSSLNDKKNEIEKDSLNYLNRKLNMSSREKRIVEQVISYSLNRITREAILKIKDNSDDERYRETMKELFDLEA
ncbi:MAG TPA: glutamyl-tRNA reductase [Clostridiaceae bacterium]|nr:glutamyl-tRNA reductase [Clostridiaceae bacterium]